MAEWNHGLNQRLAAVPAAQKITRVLLSTLRAALAAGVFGGMDFLQQPYRLFGIIVIVHPHFRPDLRGRELAQPARGMGVEDVCPDAAHAQPIQCNLRVGQIRGDIDALHFSAALTTFQS